MLYWAVVFLIVAIIAALFGFARHRNRGCRYRPNIVLHLSGDFRADPDYGPDEKGRQRDLKSKQHRSSPNRVQRAALSRPTP